MAVREGARQRWARPAVLGALVGVAHYLLYLGFFADDAAISFAYARSIAQGLPVDVVTSGQPAADGYSNPTWTLLLAAGERVGAGAGTTAKVMGALFLTGTIVLSAVIADRILTTAWARWCPVLIGASFTLVFWSASGLETGLVTFLALACTALLLAMAERTTATRTVLVVICAFALIASRPDGVVYAVAAAASLTLGALRWRRPSKLAALGAVSGIVVSGMAWVLWRAVRFGAVLPTTVYAKVTPRTAGERALDALNPVSDVWKEVFGFLVGHGVIVLVPLAAIGFVRILRGRHAAVALFAVAAAALPLSEVDWMPEYRFFAPAIPFLFLLAASGMEAATAWTASRFDGWSLPWGRIAAALVVALVVVADARLARSELSSSWRAQVTRNGVAVQARALRNTLRNLGVDDPLLMLPDVGGAVYDDDLRVLDSAGLLDEQVALDVRNHLGLQAYVFTERRPDAISTSPAYSYLWQFDGPTLLRNGYVPLDGVAQPPRALATGVFVRRDLVIGPAPGPSATAGPQPLDVAIPRMAEPGGRLVVRSSWRAGSAAAGAGMLVTLRGAAGSTIASESIALRDPLVTAADPLPDERINRVVHLYVPPGTAAQQATLEVARDGEVVQSLPVSIGPAPNGIGETLPAPAGEAAATALGDLADAMPSARDQILGLLQTLQREELRRLTGVAATALAGDDVASVARAGEDASRVRGRNQPGKAERTLAARLLSVNGTTNEERWQLARAALAFDPTNRTASRRLVAARRSVFGTAALPPPDTPYG